MLNTEMTPSLSPSPDQNAAAGRPSAPSVFDYSDYRRYLKEWLNWKKKDARGSYSGERFARRAGIRSHTLLGMVIRGKRNLSPKTIRAFSRGLGHTASEAAFFERIVLFNQAESSEDKSRYFDEIGRLGRRTPIRVFRKLRQHVRFLRTWATPAIQELTALPGFRPDPDWIRSRLLGRITRAEALRSWHTLLDLGLVRKNEKTGRYEKTHTTIDFDPGQADFAVRQYHKSMLDRTREAVDGQDVDERELSSIIFAVSDEDLPRLRSRIKEFRMELAREFGRGPSRSTRDRLIAVNTQAVQLTDHPTNEEETG